MQESEGQFNRVLIECVNGAFEEVLGENHAKALLYHVGREVAAARADAFAQTLERILGLGAHVLERRALENLYSRLGKTFQEKKGRKFIDYVNEARVERAPIEKG